MLEDSTHDRNCDSPPPRETKEAANCGVDIVVVGAGAAGLFAAIAAAKASCSVVVIERNSKPGVKILASGGGRCNLTTTRSGATLLASYPEHQRKFLRSALAALPPSALVRWFEERGVPTQVEDYEKVFPSAGRARVVLEALLKEAARLGVSVQCGVRVGRVSRLAEGFEVWGNGAPMARASAVVLAAGGESYPKAGTTGDGVALAATFGHRVTPRFPALVGLQLMTPLPHLAGITVPTVRLFARIHGKRLGTTDRPILFTHRGVSGPGPMNLSGVFAEAAGGDLEVDWVPDRDHAALDEHLLQAIRRHGKRALSDALDLDLPARLVQWLLRESAIAGESPAQALRKEERKRLVSLLKATVLPVAGTMGYDHAEVTRGGVDLSEVDPKTMESRLCPGLFLCGELLDVDGPIGGFNFQAAFGTGLLAGLAAGKRFAGLPMRPVVPASDGSGVP